MKSTRTRRVFAVAGLVGAALVGLLALATPVVAEGCEPVACPAIVKLCPQGQVACRPSPCSCALACAPEGHGCNE